jgi:hypothetical protein
MRKGVVVGALLGVSASTLVALGADADKKVAGGGEIAAGWEMRVDPKAGSGTAPKFVTMGSGFHATSGSRAIYWRPADVAKGNYKVEATFRLTAAPAHPEAYGLIFAGNDLKSANQSYMYFTLGGNGSYLIKHRANDNDIHTIVDWTASDAVAKPDEKGSRTDKLEVLVGAQKVQYLINGKEVYSTPRSQLGDAAGIAGVRVSHNLDVHIGGFKITPM